jgi:hypothetical protein
MRRLGALAAFVILVQVSPAGSARTAAKGDIVRTYAGIRCTWHQAGDPGQVVCFRSDRKGYAGAVAPGFVSVFIVAPEHLLFYRNQFRSHAYGPLTDKGVFHSESHRGLRCAWSRVSGGVAICDRTDRHGYVLTVARKLVLVANERSQAVFVRNQPS